MQEQEKTLKDRVYSLFDLLKLDCKNEKTKEILLTVLAVALILELLVRIHAFEFLEALIDIELGLPFFLSSDYLNEVFAATCTVAVLGNAILSILFGVYDKKTLGIPFQDVLNHSVVGSEQRFTIKALTMSIGFALVWYVLGCFNLLFSVLISDVFLLLFSCEDLWRFLSEKQMQKKTITEIISEVDSSRYAVYVDNWFLELRNALVPNNYQEAKEYFDLIGLVIESSPESEEQIQTCVGLHLQPYFNEACDRVGFVEAFHLLKEVIKYAQDDGLLCTRIALKYLDNLKSKDQVDIMYFEIKDLLDRIFQDAQFEDADKKSYAYAYFCAVFENYQMNPEAKQEKLNDILSYFCDLHGDDYGAYKANVIMNIVKYKILNNDNIQNRKMLFCSLVEALKQENFISSDLYIQVISEIFRAFFFAIYLEDGSLTEDYRSELLALFQTVTKDRDLISLSFMTLISDEIDKVVDFLVLDSISNGDKPRTFWDYRSPGMTWKKVVWTAEELISFALCTSHLISSTLDGREFYRILESHEFKDDEKIFLCKTLLNQYSCDGFSDELNNRAQQILEFCQFNHSEELLYWKQEHAYYQEKIIELETLINCTHLTKDRKSNQEIFQGVQKLFDRNSFFEYDPQFSLFPGKRVMLKSSFEYISSNSWKNAPKRVGSKLREYLLWYLKETLPHLPLSFKMEGVCTLIAELEAKDYLYRNYQYTDDWALQNLNSTQEYQKLLQLINRIPCDKSYQIPCKIFVKKKNIPFNFQLQYEARNLSDEECEKYVAAYTKDGLCTVAGFRFDSKHAKEYIKKNLLIEEATVFIHVSLGPDDGFQIQIQH